VIVVDASLALSWCFRDEQTPATSALLARIAVEGMLVPLFWHLEVANVLHLAVRRERITLDLRAASLADLSLLPIETDGRTIEVAWSSTIELAHRHDLTV
jgi:predicted nucleic acid-binding protein